MYNFHGRLSRTQAKLQWVNNQFGFNKESDFSANIGRTVFPSVGLWISYAYVNKSTFKIYRFSICSSREKKSRLPYSLDSFGQRIKGRPKSISRFE